MADVVYRVVETTTRTVDITIPAEVVSQGFDACKAHALKEATINFDDGDYDRRTFETKAFLRLNGL